MKTLRKTGTVLGLAAMLCSAGAGWAQGSSGAQPSTNANGDDKQAVTGQATLPFQPVKLSAAEKAAKDAKDAERAERKRKVDADISRFDKAADSTRTRMLQELERRKQEKEGQRSPAPRAMVPGDCPAGPVPCGPAANGKK